MIVLSALEELYKPAVVEIPKDWDSKQRFEALLQDLDNTSSPGFPYMREAPTIGQWLKADGLGGYDKVQVERLWYDVQSVLAGTYEHKFRVFVKDEMHKRSKAELKRWRLIIAASLPVQMVYRMAFTEQNRRLNEIPYEIPSKHGIVFCYGGWRRFLAHVKTKSCTISRDISAWDVNAPGWALDLVKQWRQSHIGATTQWLKVTDWLYQDAFERARLVFSNGYVLQQTFHGFMKSGIYNTISDNSIAMVVMHILATFRSGGIIGEIAATGDDVLQSVVSDSYLDELERSGCRVKEVIHDLEFMGTSYAKFYPEPLYYDKHLASLATKKDVMEEVLDSYCRLYAYSERRSVWRKIAAHFGIGLRTAQYYVFWYSSPMARALDRLFA